MCRGWQLGISYACGVRIPGSQHESPQASLDQSFATATRTDLAKNVVSRPFIPPDLAMLITLAICLSVRRLWSVMFCSDGNFVRKRKLDNAVWSCHMHRHQKKISFGGIPNSSSIDIPSLTTWAPFCAIVLPMWTMLSPWSKQSITWLLLSRLQGNKPHRNSPEPSEPCLRNLHQHAPELFGTLRRNLPNPASGTYTNTRRNSSEPSGTFQNLPPEPTILHRNSPEPYRNLPPEPTPADAGTLRNSPEPSSGTCSCNPHRHTPELIWAEDPISLRCWGITTIQNRSWAGP